MDDYVRDRRTRVADPRPLLQALEVYIGSRLGGWAEDGENQTIAEMMLKTIDDEIQANLDLQA